MNNTTAKSDFTRVYASNAEYTIKGNGNGWHLVTKSDGTSRICASLSYAFRWAQNQVAPE